MSATSRKRSRRTDAVHEARTALLEGVGKEVAASFPGITRLGGQIVAALYLAEGPRSMDELSAELSRSKSNVFSNLRALEEAQIVERRRESGARHDTFALRGVYPDVIIGAYLARIRRVVSDKQELVERSLSLLGDADGPEADGLRQRLDDLGRKYALFAEVFDAVLPGLEGPVDLEQVARKVPKEVLAVIARIARGAVALRKRWSNTGA